MYRYNYAHSGGGGTARRRWFVLVQMFFNPGEVAKLLNASDVVLINYGLHYCQPVRADADGRCREQFARHERELRELLASLQAFASRPGKRAVLQETSAQHFPQAGLHACDAPERRCSLAELALAHATSSALAAGLHLRLLAGRCRPRRCCSCRSRQCRPRCAQLYGRAGNPP